MSVEAPLLLPEETGNTNEANRQADEVVINKFRGTIYQAAECGCNNCEGQAEDITDWMLNGCAPEGFAKDLVETAKKRLGR